jgi:hypothetical protein
MSVQNNDPALWPQDDAHRGEYLFQDGGSAFVLIEERKPPPRIALARERMLISRLYLGLLRTITDDYAQVSFGIRDGQWPRTPVIATGH